MNIPLLNRLRQADGAFVPWPSLAGEWPGAVADLEELAAFGFELERHPFHGAAYRGPAERLCPDQIEWELGTSRIGRRIAVWDRVPSTNDIAARAASSRANDGLAVLAEEQTAGRGRRGRTWSAPPRSSILLSVLIFPEGALEDPGWLTALGAVAVAEVVAETTGADARIKWPNDVRVDRRKVAGILVERGPGAVIGIGLNVNVEVDDFPPELADSATSLLRLAGQTFDRSEIGRLLLQRLDHWYGLGLESGPASLDAPVRVR
ncbi:MAG TPA: biotin--[acetyl-CoA-carboxylase] ligase, partial [Isosphaeraceae bacterium]